MKFYDVSSVRQADENAIKKLGIPGVVLMENAGKEASHIVVEKYPYAQKICIVAGPGNKGGDGYVMARHFKEQGLDPLIVLTSPKEKIHGDARINLDIAERLCIPIYFSSECSDEDLRILFRSNDIVVDCLLGTGSIGAPRGEVERAIRLLQGRRGIVSIDIPSGLNGVTGEIYEPCIDAEITITMLAPKTGLVVMPGSEKVGELYVAHLGVSPEAILDDKPRAFLWDEKNTAAYLSPRPLGLHKGGRGTLLIVGGSYLYRGAPLLSALGALRSGCGVVIVVAPTEVCESGSSFLPEAVFHPLDNPEEVESLLSWENRATMTVVGPGLGRGERGRRLMDFLWNQWAHPLLIDGDGLYWLSEMKGCLRKRRDVILTPHEGEAATLLGTSAQTIASSRLAAARDIAMEWGTVVLKGYRSIIDNGAETAIISRGGPELSIPGSGDVLTGIIGCLVAGNHFSLLEGAASGAWIHGQAGSCLSCQRGVDGLLARDVANYIPTVLAELRGNHEKAKS